MPATVLHEAGTVPDCESIQDSDQRLALASENDLLILAQH